VCARQVLQCNAHANRTHLLTISVVGVAIAFGASRRVAIVKKVIAVAFSKCVQQTSVAFECVRRVTSCD
jgi:hypothetical protein